MEELSHVVPTRAGFNFTTQSYVSPTKILQCSVMKQYIDTRLAWIDWMIDYLEKEQENDTKLNTKTA